MQLVVRELTQGRPELVTHLFVPDDEKQIFSPAEKGGDMPCAVRIAVQIVGENFISDWSLSVTRRPGHYPGSNLSGARNLPPVRAGVPKPTENAVLGRFQCGAA